MNINKRDILKIRNPKIKYPVIDEIKKRFSPRHFTNEMIPNRILNSIFEAARHAPSGRNYQPWYYYFTNKGSRAYKKIISSLPESNHWAKTASTLIVACYEPKHEGLDNEYALYDLGASVLSLILQAQHYGYYARQIGHFDKEKLSLDLNIGKVKKPFIIIVIGKIGDYKNIEKLYLEKEIKDHPKKNKIFEII